MTPLQTCLHASAVAYRGRGLLICGSSGSGKTSLAVEMLALGADLIADDQVLVRAHRGDPSLSPPVGIQGLMELRGIGLIRLPSLSDIPLSLMVDLDQAPRERLPEPAFRDLLGHPVHLIMGKGHPGLAPALLAVMAAGGVRDPDAPLPGEDRGNDV
ncbi:MAG: serine kinase [Pseudomonadota bacterium]